MGKKNTPDTSMPGEGSFDFALWASLRMTLRVT